MVKPLETINIQNSLLKLVVETIHAIAGTTLSIIKIMGRSFLFMWVLELINYHRR